MPFFGLDQPAGLTTAVIRKEDDIFVAECLEAGKVSQGASLEEAIRNFKEATEFYLEEFPLNSRYRPLITTIELAGIASN